MKSENSCRSVSILYDVAYPFVRGGGQRRLYEVARHLISSGWEFRWYCLKTWAGPSTIEKDGIIYVGLEGDNHLYTPSGRRSISEAISYAKSIFLARESWSKSNVIWMGQWPLLHLFSAFFSGRLRRGSVIVDWWEIWENRWYAYLGVLGWVGKFLEARLLRSIPEFGNLVTISKVSQQQALSFVSSTTSSLLIPLIPNGIDWTLISSLPENPSEKSDLIYVGRLKNHKNVDHILHALHILQKKNRLLTLSIIGDGPERPKLLKMALDLCISDRVKFWGQVDKEGDVYSLMKSSRVFIHPSTGEGGGSITLLEANACGLPVLAYRHPDGIDSSLIDSGINGAWVETVSPEALAGSIDSLFGDEALLKRMRYTSQQKSSSFDWKKIAALYEHLFEEALVKRG